MHEIQIHDPSPQLNTQLWSGRSRGGRGWCGRIDDTAMGTIMCLLAMVAVGES